MSKTPFEVRLELLHIAKNLLWDTAQSARNNLSDEYHSRMTDATRATTPYPEMPSFPSTQDIIAHAEQLKQFVDHN